MKELIKKIEQVIDQFAREEISNRLSQFAMISFKEMIMNELRNFEKCSYDSHKEKKSQG